MYGAGSPFAREGKTSGLAKQFQDRTTTWGKKKSTEVFEFRKPYTNYN